MAAAIGAAATLLVCLLAQLGWLDRLEWIALDQQFRHARAMPVDRRIVLITISDRDLAQFGRWPWPRDVQAALVAVPCQLGASAILVDLEYLEPQPLRADLPPDADMLIGPDEGPELLEAVHADGVLAAALRRCGRAYLAFHYTHAPARRDPQLERWRSRIRTWLAAHRQDADEPFGALARAVWAAHTARPFEIDSPQRRAMFAALRELVSRHATRQKRWPVRLDAVRDVARPVADVVPVYAPQARAAAGCGFVNFEPDRDGVVRRLQLLVREGDVVYTQLALRLAVDVLGIDPAQTRSGPGWIELPRADGTRLHIKLDSAGRMLLPWTTEPFDRIPSRAILAVDENRRRIATNRRILLEWLAGALADPAMPGHEEAARLVSAVRRLRAQLARAEQLGRDELVHALRTMLTPIERQLAQQERAARDWVRRTLQSATQPAARNAQLRAVADRFRQIDVLRRRNREIEHTIENALEQLRPRLAGRICLIGYTATSLADIKPTPTSPASPGVLAHANLLNGLLTGRLVQAAPPGVNAAATLVMGLLATAASLGRRPRTAFWSVLGLLLAYGLLAGWLVFDRGSIAVAVVAPLLAAGSSHLAIALHHYFFVDRERRALASALSQFTAREIAEKVAEDPALCRRVELRDVTPMFTDLRGFTALAERLGPQATQQLLNVCLGELTDVLLRHRALVNKFLGDGVFAFWNAVILPADDHASRACAAALELLEAIERLRRSDRDGARLQALHLRVGIATGQAIVGPCGSPQKYDYTCIGDAVNVAARLESANRFFGTQVLVNDQTRQAAGAQFAFRSLGGVRVKGRHQPVPVYELLGRTPEIDPAAIEYAQAFAAAVQTFQQRDFAQAESAFRRLLAQRRGDLAARLYLEQARRWRHAAPPRDWPGVLELTEK